MPLLRLSDVHLHYGEQVLLDRASLQVEPGERICLVGRNGVGKSTFMRLIEGVIKADSGEVWQAPELKIARLEQEPRLVPGRTVYDEVAAGLANLADALSRFHRLTQDMSGDTAMRELEAVQRELDAADAWRYQQRIDTVMTRLGLDGDVPLDTLSGGWLRRVALARSLVVEPQLLLLDEPTNHLDIDTITWLEGELLQFSGAVLFITHDRALARRLATRVVELDRGRLISYETNYDGFVVQREQRLEIEERENALFDKRLAEEEVWIRQGIKARRTRNEGRVRALKQLRDERSQRREQIGRAGFGIESAERSGKLVAELEGVRYEVGGRRLIDGLNLLVQRGDRVGLIGPNGIGKSTLLRLILGELEPQAGHVRRGERLEVAYFDQLRNRFDADATLIDIVGHGREFIDIRGARKHIISYLEEFLFRPDQSRRPARHLSGGERARLQLARLFSQPVNVLVLDEPTNDLDVESLELLEQLLLEFDGTILLVSHDRAFLDNVVTSSLVFAGNGRVEEYVGGYSDWLRQRPAAEATTTVRSSQAPGQPTAGAAAAVPTRSVKLGYKEQRELDGLPKAIEQAEAEIAEINAVVSAPGFYEQPQPEVAAALERLARRQSELDALYERWLTLSEG